MYIYELDCILITISESAQHKSFEIAQKTFIWSINAFKFWTQSKKMGRNIFHQFELTFWVVVVEN